MTVITAPAETEQIKRLVEFASDINQLANERPDFELRVLVDDLHADLIDPDEED